MGQAAAASTSSVRQAMTLAEIFVVMGILVVLATMALPLMAVVRDQAARARCSSSMRQAAMASFTYAQDHRGVLPDVELASGQYWTVLIQDYVGQSVRADNTSDFSGANFFQTACPAMDRTKKGSGIAVNAQLQWTGSGGADDDAHNVWARQQRRAVWQPFRLSALTSSASRLFLMDSFVDNDLHASHGVYRNHLFPTYESTATWSNAFRHHGRLQIVLLDGHASSLRTPQDVTTGLTGGL